MTRHSLKKWFQKPHLARQYPRASGIDCLRRYNTHPSTDTHYIPSYPTTPPTVTPPHSPSLNHSSPKPCTRVDPFTLVSSDLTSLRTSLLTLLRSGHPALSELAEYYFLPPSKQIRPLLVLLFSQATNGLGSQWKQKLWQSKQEREGGKWEELDRPLTRPDVLNDWNPRINKWTSEFGDTFEIGLTWDQWGKRKLSAPSTTASIYPHPKRTTTTIRTPKLHAPSLILPTQSRLAQILEMIHTASLLHDDVIDGSPLRRGMPSAPSEFGKKLSVLGGNFILGRASAALARLGDREATELIASILSNLVDGEILQLKKVKEGEGKTNEDAWNRYLQKTYLKTASLMAKGARAAVVLGGCKEGDIAREIAYAYGRNLGIAFQLVDDALDYEFASEELGKPGGADLQLGLATGPALYAWEEHPEMGELIQRKFGEEGDVELARDYITRSSGVQRTRALAQQYADKAKEVIQFLPESEARGALEVLAERVVGRKS